MEGEPCLPGDGGGSSPVGPDLLFPMQLASEAGIDPQDVNYVSSTAADR